MISRDTMVTILFNGNDNHIEIHIEALQIPSTERYKHPGQIIFEQCFDEEILDIVFIQRIFTKIYDQNTIYPNEKKQILFYMAFGSGCTIATAKKRGPDNEIIGHCYYIVCTYSAKYIEEQSKEEERCFDIGVLIENQYYFNKFAPENPEVHEWEEQYQPITTYNPYLSVRYSRIFGK